MLKLSRKRVVKASLFYFLGISVHLTLMRSLNEQHIENPFLLASNIGLFNGCYWGVIHALGNKR